MNENTQTTAVVRKNPVAVSAPKPVDALKKMLSAQSIQEQFRNALKENSGTFIASVIDLFNSDVNLQKCSAQSIVCEALKAAVLHLPINKALGFAHIIPFNNNKKGEDGRWTKVMEPTFQMGYKGYIQLAMRTGQYETINADVVYEGELRKADKLTGGIRLDGERTSDRIIGYFCYFKLINGFSKTLYMSVEQMAAHAKRYSKGIGRDVSEQSLAALASQPMQGEGKSVGWLGNFHGMAIKTVVRLLLSKYGYLSIEMQKAVTDDQTGDSYEVRDAQIQSGANAQVIDMDKADYTEVEPAKLEPGNTGDNAAPAVEDDMPYSEESECGF